MQSSLSFAATVYCVVSLRVVTCEKPAYVTKSFVFHFCPCNEAVRQWWWTQWREKSDSAAQFRKKRKKKELKKPPTTARNKPFPLRLRAPVAKHCLQVGRWSCWRRHLCERVSASCSVPPRTQIVCDHAQYRDVQLQASTERMLAEVYMFSEKKKKKEKKHQWIIAVTKPLLLVLLLHIVSSSYLSTWQKSKCLLLLAYSMLC